MYLLPYLNKIAISGPGSLSHHSFPISSLSTYLEMVKQAKLPGRSFFKWFQCKDDWSMYRKHLWPFPATLKQRYASLGLFSWCAGYCCLFVTILSPWQLSRSTNWWILSNQTGDCNVIVVLIDMVVVLANRQQSEETRILVVDGIQTYWLLWLHEDKPCAAVQFPHSGPEQVSWMKNSLFLRAMREKLEYFS